MDQKVGPLTLKDGMIGPHSWQLVLKEQVVRLEITLQPCHPCHDIHGSFVPIHLSTPDPDTQKNYGCPPARHCYQRSISCSAHRSHHSSLKSALQPIIDFVSILQCSRNTLGFCLKYKPFSMFLAYYIRTAHDVHLNVANQINREPIMLS